jgi:menaquinone-specific isochorismate synthase
VTEVVDAPFRVTTRAIADVAAADAAAEREAGEPSAVWAGGDDRMVGYGVAARLEFSGPDRVRDAAAAWRELTRGREEDLDVRVPGTGLVAFGTFAFADDSAATSVLVVPRRIVGRRAGRPFVTDVAGGPGEAPRPRLRPAEPAFSDDDYRRAVAEAVRRIRAGELEKVVLARILLLDPPPGSDPVRTLRALHHRYGDAWTFAVDGFFGASPETLVASDGTTARARVLAGTAERRADPAEDAATRDRLLASGKNRFEHALAVDSLLVTLGMHVREVVLGRPFALGLPNVWHLATDAEGVLTEDEGVLDLVAALHPTAAVAGAPREAALRLIRELEPFDRGRYAGPVGWLDARGAGEWAIGLRCAELLDDGRVQAFAGAGVVAASDAGEELAETRWKFQPVLEALGLSHGRSPGEDVLGPADHKAEAEAALMVPPTTTTE